MRDYLDKGIKISNCSNRTYCIDRLIGEGASCVAYSAKDSKGNKYIIKEFYPSYIDIHRTQDDVLLVNDSESDKYNRALDKFINGINIQRSLRDNGESINNQIFAVVDEFHANNTYYSVVTEYQGKTYKYNEKLSLFDRVKICKSVAEYVSAVHSAGYLCLDIKPANIYVLPETNEFTMMFDFDGVCSKEDVGFGRNLSYSEEWAAPEQLISNAYNRISEQTDIYILGELLFWSIFNRHSKDEEHRKSSQYSYEYSIIDESLPCDIELMLDEIFHHTLRSSSTNRYKSVQEYINSLDKLLTLLYPHQVRILDMRYYGDSFFVGREEEIKSIKTLLTDRKRAFIKGVGGIGKTEIINQYLKRYSSDYKYVIYMVYENSLLYTLCNSCFIANFEQRENEPDRNYVIRKIHKLKELLTDKNYSLIVIDGINVELETTDNKDIWESLFGLSNCDIVISTRCNQDMYSNYQIDIDELDEHELISVFSQYCPFDECEIDSVKSIIENVGYHTLTVELIAKQTMVSRCLPSTMLNQFREEGLFSSNRETVKWKLEQDSISKILKRLFSISDLSENQIDILVKISLAPEKGIDEKLFVDFYSITTYKDIQYLIDNGWLYELKEETTFLKMHPIVAKVVIDYACNANILKEYCYKMIRKMYDAYKDLNYGKYLRVFYVIGYRLYNFGGNPEYVADYLLMLSIVLSNVSGNDEKNIIAQYAKNIYDKLYSVDDYSARKELAYIYFIDSKNVVEKNELNIIKNHIKKSQNIDDLYMVMRWKLQEISTFIKTYDDKKTYDKKLSKLLISMYMTYLKYLFRFRSNPDSITDLYEYKYGFLIDYYNDIINDIEKNIAYYLEADNDYEVFCTHESYSYVQANKFRENSINSLSNIILKSINKAKIDIINNDYKEAKAKLLGAANYCIKNNYVESEEFLKNSRLTGGLCFVQKDYENAIVFFDILIHDEAKILKKVNYYNYILLSRSYIYLGDFEKADQIMKSLLYKIDQKKPFDYDILLGEINYNQAIVLFKTEQYEEAFYKFQEALECFDRFPRANSITMFGFSRCIMGKAEIRYYNSEKDVALERMRFALKGFKKSVGEKHPEYIQCKERIKEIESE